MNPIDNLIAEVEALDAKATKGPFVVSPDTNYVDDTARGRTFGIRDESGTYVAALEGDTLEGKDKDNAKMFAAYRTAAPRLARALKLAVEALEEIKHSHGLCAPTTATFALATITAELSK